MAKKEVKGTSPKGGKQGCLCKDGTYSNECCDGELLSQGIGDTTNQTISNVNHIINETTTIVSR
jgi:hypothetical protein